MTHTTVLPLAGKGLFILLALVLVTSLVTAQQGDLILNGDQTNNGTIKVKRDVVNNTAGMVTVDGTGVVRLDRNTENHAIKSTTLTYPITFSNLSMTQGRPVTCQVDVTVTNNLTIGDATNPYTGSGFDIGARTLTISNLSSYLPASTAPLTFSGGTVNYTLGSGSQTVLVNPNGTTYGTLGLTGNASMTIPDATGGAFSVATLTHSGTGTLIVNDSATVTASATVGTLANVASGKALVFTGNTSSSTISGLTTLDGTIKKSGDQPIEITVVTNTASSGVIENAAAIGALSIPTLSANAGKVQNTGAASIAFTTAASAGDIEATDGSLSFTDLTNSGNVTLSGDATASFANAVDNNGGTIALSNTSQAMFNAAFTNAGTLTFGSTSQVTYAGSAYAIATPAGGYGNLVIGGSANKTAGSSFDVNGNLTLTNSLTMSSGTLSLKSASSNVSGDSSVIGAVRRAHNFANGTNYTFNRANVYMGFATTGGAGDITLAMTPSSDPTGLTTTKYMQRKYAVTVGTNPGTLSAMQLYYLDGTEEQGSANEARLGIRQRVGGNWGKVFSTGYTRGSGSGLVTISGLSGVSIASATEFAMTQASLVAVASADWATPSTWDENLSPAGEDVEIPSFAVTISSGAQSATSVDLQGAGTLAIAGGSLAVTKNLNIASGSGLNLSGGTLTVTDSVVNAGNIAVASGQSLTTALLHNNSGANTVTFTGNAILDSLHNDGGTIAFNGGATTISRAVTNLAGVISVGGTTNMLTASALTLSSAGNITVNGATGILNIGQSGTASNLTMSGTSVLTLNNAASHLNVFGNLELGASSILSNIGEITVGE